MDKNAAINLIDKTFNNAFDEAQFTNFIQNLLNDFEIKPYKASGNTIWEDQRDHISYYKRIGKYIDPEGEALDVLIVQVKNVSKLERARTALRNFVIKHLNNFEKDYALVAFYSKEDEGFDWRFSFIKMEYQSYLDEEKQKVKMRKDFTPAKRYSFLVGKYEKSHTAKTQLLPLLQNIANNPTISELEKAFSIERVTDEFFEQYKNLYIKVYEYFNKQKLSIFQNTDLDAAGFTKKLLGQIVFLYFLQKKGWLGVPKDEKWGNGDKHFIQKLFEKAQQENKNFFKDYLQHLFYEALAKERNNDNSFYPRFNTRIPFLNGGLFEAPYDWKNTNVSIPEVFFRSGEEQEDKRTGILDVFDRYNFTIKEDEPLDKEVAVDPEMLGKVFENMLEIKERKSKGAFYTPREIVHYMCQESLIHYLDNALNNYNGAYQEFGNDQTNMFGNEGNNGQQAIQTKVNDIPVPKEDIEQYIREGQLALENDVRVAARGETKTYQFQLPESIRNNADVIDKKLTEIRICDPAIGSGAFPVGLLHELVTAHLILKPHLTYNYYNNKLKEFDFKERESVSTSRYVYRLKKHIIQESIYGVDIDRSAIDIARLRLWLSLVVDEDHLEPIETLPNLDYKIVCGNSLIGMPDGTMRDLDVEKELEALKEEFYTVTNEKRKKELRNQINTKIRELLNTAETFAGYKIDFDFKLYFSEVWHKKGGFDILIGNPPYGAKLSKEEKTLFKNQFSDVHMRTPDTFNYFTSNGLRLLKENGVLNYIVPNNLLFQSEYEKTRKLLLSKNSFHIAINLGDGVFNTATVPSCIFLNTKGKNNYNRTYKYADLRNVDKKVLDFKSIFSKTSVASTLQVPAAVFGISESEFEIIKKLKEVSVTIDDIAEEMASGISTGGDKIFRIETEFAKENNFENELLKPVLVGGEIDKYKIKNTKHCLIYTDRSTEISNYKNIENYLEPFKDKLNNRSEAKIGVMPWFSLNRQRYPKLFEEEKIIMRQTSDKIRATFDKESYYVIDSILVFKKKKECQFHYKFVLAMLNSTVNAFLYNKFSQEGGRTFAQVKPKNVRKLYIPKTNYGNQKPIDIIVDYLGVVSNMESMSTDLFSFFELVLDAISFELFLPNEFQASNKTILKHLTALKPIKKDMSPEEKLGIIQSEYQRLYDPDHPVRYAIETLDSIEEVRIIREALKN